ncbi:uncharacterized protein LOC143922071 [Arctopsyche grandis]|uniref:uncharacterized protein LOC143922071 n=1 Tax=Arctopsyche grandis TaxID=121162 RepID=UPI00406D85C3
MTRLKQNEMTPAVITLWYRPPEILLGSSSYTKSSDVWSLGCILLEMIKKVPIFKSEVEVETLNLISGICGSINEENMPGCSKLPLFDKYKISEEIADLADKMLVLDPRKRPTVLQCLEHPIFSK